MGRRILAFFLGMLFGIILLFGGLIAAIYIGATTVKPGDIYPESDKFLGDLAQMTLYDIYLEISNLYKEKLGITNDDGLYFTLGEFLERYHIDPVAAFGKPLPKDLLEIPIFELFGGTPDTSMTQMKASILFSVVNFMTQSVDEEGNLVGGYFSASAIEKLYAHSMAELTDSEKGVKYVFAELLLVDMLSTAFPAEEPTEGDKLMWALGQSSIGKMLGGMGGNLMIQFKADGAFETVGTLALRELIGGASRYMKVIFGDKAFADLIDDNGNLIVDGVMDNLYLGVMFGYDRKEVDVSTGYTELSTNDGVTTLQSDDGLTYAMSVDGVAYLAKLTCDDTEHTHSADCVDFVWYNLTSCEADGHEHSDECYSESRVIGGMMEKLSCERIKNLNSLSETVKKLTVRDVLEDDVSGPLKALQDTKIGDLSKAIDNIHLGELLNYELNEVNDSDYNTTVTEDGTVKAKGDDIAKLEDGKWYSARLNCKDKAHGDNHTADCYDLAWFQKHDDAVCDNTSDDHSHTDACYLTTVEGMMGKLSGQKVKDMNNLSATIKTFTLKDILTDSVPAALKSIENTPVGEIGTALNNMYLGEFLAYAKRPVDDSGYSKVNGLDNVKQNENGDIIKLADDGIWYEAVLNCADHTHGDDCYIGGELTCDKHTHNYECYDYAWYSLTCKEESSEHEHIFGENGCYAVVGDLIGRISRLKMSELSGDRIKQEVNETKLKEIINIENANGLFKELGDVKIGNLSNELDALYVGVAMGYDRIQVDKGEDWTLVASDTRTGGNEIWADGSNNYYFYDQLRNKYYVAQLNCAQDHKDESGQSVAHNFNCYGYIWIDCKDGYNEDGSKNDHPHTIGCNHAKGLNSKIANLRIDELSGGNLTRIATNLTIDDLIESEMMSLGKDDNEKEENAYKLAIICCKDSRHFHTDTSGIEGYETTTDFCCTLQDYFIYKNTKDKNISAKKYWLLTHGIADENNLQQTDIEHRDTWKNQSLTNFITTLLGAL